MQRRYFLALPAAGLLARNASPFAAPPPPAAPGLADDAFPNQDPARVREMVTVAHGGLQRVRELVAEYPELAKANLDWGFGDWESALGAASHTGRRQIAHLLLEHGARPTIFSAAMLGQLSVVQAFIEASPGVQHLPGPHGIPLIRHARAGGEHAAAVVAYLAGLMQTSTIAPLPDDVRDKLLGAYRYGEGESEVLVIALRRDALVIGRPGHPDRGLIHLGDGWFHPAGAESVRISFEGPAPEPTHLRVMAGARNIIGRRENG